MTEDIYKALEKVRRFSGGPGGAAEGSSRRQVEGQRAVVPGLLMCGRGGQDRGGPGGGMDVNGSHVQTCPVARVSRGAEFISPRAILKAPFFIRATYAPAPPVSLSAFLSGGGGGGGVTLS
eukprot:7388011-Prymnesium_polylepis.2